MKLVLTIAEIREIVAGKYGIRGNDWELEIDYSYPSQDTEYKDIPDKDITGFSDRLLSRLFMKGYISSVADTGILFDDKRLQTMKEIKDFYYDNGFGGVDDCWVEVYH